MLVFFTNFKNEKQEKYLVSKNMFLMKLFLTNPRKYFKL